MEPIRSWISTYSFVMECRDYSFFMIFSSDIVTIFWISWSVGAKSRSAKSTMQSLSSLFSPSVRSLVLLLLCTVKPLAYLFSCLCNTIFGTLNSSANLQKDVSKRKKKKQDFAQILYNKCCYFFISHKNLWIDLKKNSFSVLFDKVICKILSIIFFKSFPCPTSLNTILQNFQGVKLCFAQNFPRVK